MDKKEKSINSHIDKAIGYSDKAANRSKYCFGRKRA